jgi:hypothetical protein
MRRARAVGLGLSHFKSVKKISLEGYRGLTTFTFLGNCVQMLNIGNYLGSLYLHIR